MHRPRATRLLLLIVLSATACGDSVNSTAPAAMTTARGAVSELEAPAAELLRLLSEGRYAEIAGQMHYPAIYTPAQLIEDRSGVEESLTGLMSETGEIANPRLSTDWGPFLQINVAGGNDSYWKAHPAGQGGSAVLFDVDFGKIGPGVIQFAFLESSGVQEVRSVNIGVRGSRADARETMERIMRSLKGEPPPSPQDSLPPAPPSEQAAASE